jgi:hypothetical protein
MSVDSSECQFTITAIQKDDPTFKEFDALPEEEKQSIFHVHLQLLPGSDRLEIEENDLISWRDFKLTETDWISLEALGMQEKLKVNGGGSLGEEPFKSRTLIVVQRPIKEPIDLPQPHNCEVIYYQDGDEWRRFPADAPILKKRFRLIPDPAHQALYHFWAEAYFGSDEGAGGGAFNWERTG